MAKIEVYSCVTGNYDNVSQSLFSALPEIDCDARFTLFTDAQMERKKAGWNIKPLAYEELCRRRSARWHKVNSHLLFPDAEITVWIDGSQAFKPIKLYADLVGPHMTGFHIATFKHPVRTCIYQEAQACKMLKKDNPLLIDKQVYKYRKMGYPSFNGMVETACVIRKNKKPITEFNQVWWNEIDNNSLRDQLSFNFAIFSKGLKYQTIKGERTKSPYFRFIGHKK